MTLTFDDLTSAFLLKIKEYELLCLTEENRESTVDSYIKKSLASFKKSCIDYDLTVDTDIRELTSDFSEDDVDEIVDIVTEGMVVQWLKPYVNAQDILENVLNTKDFSQYSPAELLMRVTERYKLAKSEFTQMCREYSYNHGDLTGLHL